MSDRISDEQLQLYLDQLESLRKRNPGEWMHKAPWRMALEEIRARRARDLTGEELQAIDDLVYVWNCRESNRMLERERIALRAFTKLLKQRTGSAVQSDTCNTRGNR